VTKIEAKKYGIVQGADMKTMTCLRINWDFLGALIALSLIAFWRCLT
jgi:hypothetical protein